MRRIQSGKKVNMRKRGNREREREKRHNECCSNTFCNDSCHANYNKREREREKQRKHKQGEAFFFSSLIFVCYLYINNIWWLHQYDDLRFFDVLIGKLKLTRNVSRWILIKLKRKTKFIRKYLFIDFFVFEE